MKPPPKIDINLQNVLGKYLPIRMIFRFNGSGFDGLIETGHGIAWSTTHVKVFYSEPDQAFMEAKVMHGVDGSVYYSPPVLYADPYGSAQYLVDSALHEAGEGFIVDPFEQKASKEIWIHWQDWLGALTPAERHNAPFTLYEEIPF